MGRRELLRIQAEVEIHFKNYDQFFKEYSKDISKGGLFIKTKEPFKPQTVLEIKLFLPGEKEPINAVGEVVHIIDPETAEERGWESGMGVQFVDFEETMQGRLQKYIAKQAQKKPEIIKDRRRHPRTSIRIKVRFPDLTTLLENYARDISQGGIFIPTNDPKPVGTVINLTLIHPETEEEVELEGEVVRVVSETDAQIYKEKKLVPGMGIKFVNVSKEQQKKLEQFVFVEYPVDPTKE